MDHGFSSCSRLSLHLSIMAQINKELELKCQLVFKESDMSTMRSVEKYYISPFALYLTSLYFDKRGRGHKIHVKFRQKINTRVALKKLGFSLSES